MSVWTEIPYRLGLTWKAEGKSDYLFPRFAKAADSGRRVRILGDHSSYHCGGAAVMQALHNVALSKGWEVVSGRESYDVLVVNGEGTMHSGRNGFHLKMGVLAKAVEAGVPAFLVNSVWQNNPSDYDDVLRKLSGIIVRENASRDEMKERHGIEPKVAIDASFFAPVSPTPDLTGFEGKFAYTDLWLPGRRWVTDASLAEGGAFLSLKDMNWSEAVNAIRSASHLVTGRHHAVYAACRARKLFASAEGNTHKISGLFKSAGVEMPVAHSVEQLRAISSRIHEYSENFDALFDWMEIQDPSNIFPSLSDAWKDS